MTHRCNVCKVTLQVETQYLTGNMELKEYHCPNCKTEYKARSSNTPRVRIIYDEDTKIK